MTPEQEKALQALHSENERLGLYKDAYAEQEPVAIDWSAVHKKLELVWYRELSADEGLDEIQDLIHTHQPQRTEQEPVESWEELHNALQRIDTAAVGLPTFEVRHEGGLDAVVQNIVDAIVALHERPTPQRTEQEPVAWRLNGESSLGHGKVFGDWKLGNPPADVADLASVDKNWFLEFAYTHPPQRTEQEPVGWFTQARNFVPISEFTEEEAKNYGWNALYLRPPQRTEQEPVAWRTFDGEGGYDYRTYDTNEDYADEWEKRNPNHKGWVEPLYKDPKPCPTCEALARTVMLDQTSHDTHRAQSTEQNFCSRCGKRTPDLTHIHTCTPPKETT